MNVMQKKIRNFSYNQIKTKENILAVIHKTKKKRKPQFHQFKICNEKKPTTKCLFIYSNWNKTKSIYIKQKKKL